MRGGFLFVGEPLTHFLFLLLLPTAGAGRLGRLGGPTDPKAEGAAAPARVVEGDAERWLGKGRREGGAGAARGREQRGGGRDCFWPWEERPSLAQTWGTMSDGWERGGAGAARRRAGRAPATSTLHRPDVPPLREGPDASAQGNGGKQCGDMRASRFGSSENTTRRCRWGHIGGGARPSPSGVGG